MASCKTRAKMQLVKLRGVTRAISHFTRFLSCKRNPYLTGPRKKKALIVGINYTRTAHKGKLLRSIEDAVEAKKTLIDVFGFKKEDIILLVDEEGGSDQPTYARILQELQNFVKSDDNNVDYVFIYVGHAYQSDAKSEKEMQEEEDGKSEYIIPLDSWSSWDTPIHSKAIYDRDLRSYLVDRLGRGSKLLAIFNTCHSATLLSITNVTAVVNSPVWFVVWGAKAMLCDPFQMSVVRKGNAPDQYASIFSRVAHKFPWRLQSTAAKTGDLCTGLCHLANKGLKYPRVVCISGCKDSEETPESDEEVSMLASLMKLFRENPQPTFKEIMDNTRVNVKQTRFKCVNKTEQASSQADKSLNSKSDFLATLSHLHRHVFAKLRPWNPEMAAEHTIDMDQKLIVCLP
ncbi:hypothetical protein D9619_009287 [Psilocybe cf. subviscida]|uniref:Uncharacterized protein n=1 Tax=Psilocybe cf. subviscida TaxID=2480587 RepID=A0A8H5BUE1_9AGAR|nr:hypothetical protein D9619_009287 [Psilocybe cf. subviscida]